MATMDVDFGEDDAKGIGATAATASQDLQSMLQQASPTVQTLEARLRQLRQQVNSMLVHQHPPSAVLHPFYQGPDDEQSFPPKATQECVRDVRESLKTFMQQTGRAFGSAAVAASPTAAFTPGGGVKMDVTASTAASTAAKAQQSVDQAAQNGTVHLVSLLREQSTHTQAVCRINDALQAAMSGKSDREGGEETSKASTGFFPGQLRICAFNDQDKDEDKGTFSRWPTSDQIAAESGLKKLVDALESIGSADMQLEAFAEAHASSSGGGGGEPSSYTLTLAARILVIDVDLSLEQKQKQDGGASALIWTPLVRVRLSYATDSAASSDGAGQVQRSAKLAGVLQCDVQSIAEAVFGTSTTSPSRETTQHHLRRLKASVQTLKRLDSLSSQLHVAGKPDLFAVMDDACRQAGQVVPGWEGCRVVEHVGRPYATVIYAGLSDTLSEEATVDAMNKSTLAPGGGAMQTLHIDVGSFDALPLDNGDLTPSHCVARLDPPRSMTRQSARKLAKAAGVRCGDEKDDDGADHSPSARLYVRLFPYVSLQHLRGAIAVLLSIDDDDDDDDAAVQDEASRPSKRPKA